MPDTVAFGDWYWGIAVADTAAVVAAGTVVADIAALVAWLVLRS